LRISISKSAAKHAWFGILDTDSVQTIH